MLVDTTELAENVNLNIQGNNVSIEIVNSVLHEMFCFNDKNTRTHMLVGCLLSSALACVLVKTSGRPVSIQNEVRNDENKTIIITYRIEQE